MKQSLICLKKNENKTNKQINKRNKTKQNTKTKTKGKEKTKKGGHYFKICKKSKTLAS